MRTRNIYRRSFLEKIHDILFLETNMIRTLAIAYAFFALLFFGGLAYVVIHFLHKYW